jgi:N6-adenosine-specific RNA methylase IME4
LSTSQTAIAKRLISEGKGDRLIAESLKITRHAARNLIREIERKDRTLSAAAEIEPRTAAEFAQSIIACWNRHVEAIFQVGRLLLSAKERLDHGEFQGMIDRDLPFGPRYAQMFMKVAADKRLANAKHTSLLPASPSTLYEITKLDDDSLNQRFSDGTINPEMERRHISQVVKTANRQRRESELGAKTVQENSEVDALAVAQQWPERSCAEAMYVGRAAEHLVCADALMRGWNAFLASQGSPYDVVFEKNGRIVRVQVKGSQWTRNVNASGVNERHAYSFAVLRRGKNGDGPRLTVKEADIVACVAMDIGVIAYLPVDECTSTVQLSAETVPDNSYERTYTRSIREYPLQDAIDHIDSVNCAADFRRIFPPLPARRFNVIYADCPWVFSAWSEMGMDRAPENHYPTVSADVLRGLGSYIPATDDAVLFLWATSPMLVAAMDVMADWGFDYKTNMVWEKDKIGTGYWFRNKHELLLVGTRGGIPAPAMGDQPNSIIAAPTGRHSRKPAEFRAIIDTMFPSLLKLEMFARERHEGWAQWGAEVPKEAEAAE